MFFETFFKTVPKLSKQIQDILPVKTDSKISSQIAFAV